MVLSWWNGMTLGAVAGAILVSNAVAADPAGTSGKRLGAALPTVQSSTPANARKALNRMIPELNVDAVPLGRVLEYLHGYTGANIVVNWKVLEAANITKDTPITLSLVDVSLRKALRLVLDQASPDAMLTFALDSNVLTITTLEDADKTMVTRVYIVDDLVMTNNTTSTPPSFDLTKVTQSGSTSGSGSGTGSGSLFTPGPTDNAAAAEDTPQKRGEDLVKLITEVVRPTIWRDNGGQSSIRYFNGKLIVTAPLSVQEAIGGPMAPEGGQRLGM